MNCYKCGIPTPFFYTLIINGKMTDIVRGACDKHHVKPRRRKPSR